MHSVLNLNQDYIKFLALSADKRRMQRNSEEILIHSHHLTHNTGREAYEFILDHQLKMVGWLKVGQPKALAMPALQEMLFELKHVRINPTIDNATIIAKLTYALQDIGVSVAHPIPNASMAGIKPMGEISDNVRFYLNAEHRMIFLSPAMRPKLAVSNPSS